MRRAHAAASVPHTQTSSRNPLFQYRILSQDLHQSCHDHFINHRRACAARVTVVNPRRACAARVTVVGSVCVSVKSHLTYGASVRPENAVTYSAGSEGQKICGVFSETAPLQRSSTPSVVRLMRSRPLRKMRMRMSSPVVH